MKNWENHIPGNELPGSQRTPAGRGAAKDRFPLGARAGWGGGGSRCGHHPIIPLANEGRTRWEPAMMRLLIAFALVLASSAARGDAPADLDRDGDVDLADFALLQSCFSGSGVAQPAQSCQAARLTPDAAVDLADFVAWTNCLDGPGAAAPTELYTSGHAVFPRVVGLVPGHLVLPRGSTVRGRDTVA